jgi:hypothetical protein
LISFIVCFRGVTRGRNLQLDLSGRLATDPLDDGIEMPPHAVVDFLWCWDPCKNFDQGSMDATHAVEHRCAVGRDDRRSISRKRKPKMNDLNDTRVAGESDLTLRQLLLGDHLLVALMAPGTNAIRRSFGRRFLVAEATPVCT